jgi:hypothetical protein
MSRSFFKTAVEATQSLPAARQQVFETLMQWNTYPEWNPYITRIDGKPLVGQVIQVYFFMGFGPRLPLSCKLDQMDAQKTTAAWEYKAFLPWLYTARHVFTVEDTRPGTCRIVQTEHIQGLMACPVFGFFHRLLQKRFQFMHTALLDRMQRSAA